MSHLKVKDLITMLQELEDPNRIVVLSSDAEGNKYRTLNQVTLGKWLESDLDRGDVLPDNVQSGVKAIVLYP